MVTVGVGVLCLMLGLMLGYEIAYYKKISRSMSSEEMLKSLDIEKLTSTSEPDEESRDEWN